MNIIIATLCFVGVFLLVRKQYLEDVKEYQLKHGMTKKEFLAMRRQMNPEQYGKFSLQQWIQDLSKN